MEDGLEIKKVNKFKGISQINPLELYLMTVWVKTYT